MEDPWQFPAPSLPFDRAVRKYLFARMLDKGELKARGVVNPYFTARQWFAQAIARAHAAAEVEGRIANWRGRVKQHRSKAAALRSRADRLAADLVAFVDGHSSPEDVVVENWIGDLTTRPVRGMARRDHTAEFQRYNHLDDARIAINTAAIKLKEAVAALSAISSAADESIMNVKHIQISDNHFIAAFVESLAYCTRQLTGKDPQPSAKWFQNMVAEAHNTLLLDYKPIYVFDDNNSYSLPFWNSEAARRRSRMKGKKDLISWENQIRKALSRIRDRPGDGLDRYESFAYSPPSSFYDLGFKADGSSRP